MGLALARILALVICFGGAAYFIHDARRNLRDGHTLYEATFLVDGKIQSYSRESNPVNFRLTVGLKFFAAVTLLAFGLIYLWFGLTG